MKKIFTSVGLVALGAVTVQAAGVGGGAADTSKTWSVSATLRGFYDDNYITATKGAERESYGFSISPSVGLSLPLDQTTFSLKYTFGAYWFEDRRGNGNSPWDLTHQFDAYLNHAFDERFTLDLMDSFVIAQEPGLLDPSGITTTPYRTEGNNIRNFFNAQLNSRLTEKWSAVFGYANTYYNYENSAKQNEAYFTTSLDAFNNVISSYSGQSDRFEHLFLLNLRWQMLQETVGVLGYNFGMTDYTSDEFVANRNGLPIPFAALAKADVRNSHTHYAYLGLDHNFSQQLTVTLRGGAQWADYYNDPIADNAANPYADVGLNYRYRPGSNLRLGVTHTRNHTDQLAPNTANGQITVDQESTILYAQIQHRFTPRLTGLLNGHWQDSQFNGGSIDGLSDQFLGFGAALRYQFDRHYTGEIGYNFDSLNSDIAGRDYDRNRIFIGVTAAY